MQSAKPKSLYEHTAVPSRTSKRSWMKRSAWRKLSVRKVRYQCTRYGDVLVECISRILCVSSSVQETKNGFTKNNFSSPEFDPAYVRAKELEQLEREAEEKAKAILLQYSQHDVSHEMVMRNGMMVRKTSIDSDTSTSSITSPGTSPKSCAFFCHKGFWTSCVDACCIAAKSYPFTDKSRKRTPSAAGVKAVARFQQQLAESRAKEEERAERKASIDLTRKTSTESLPRSGMIYERQSLWVWSLTDWVSPTISRTRSRAN